MAEGKKGLFGLLGNFIEGMKDDEGLFRGGEEGRVFGRFKDKFEDKATSYDPSMEDGRVNLQHAQEFAKNMDISNKEDVFELQNMLNALGVKDYEGKELATDAMMGDRTLSALRALQGEDREPAEGQGPGPWAYDYNETPSWWDVISAPSPKRAGKKARDKFFNLNKYIGTDEGTRAVYQAKPKKQGPGY